MLRSGVAAPNLRKCSMKVSAQDKLDVDRRVFAPKQSFRKIVNLLGVIDPVQIVLPFRANTDVASIQIDVASHTDVLNTGHFHDMVDVIQNVFDRGWPTCANEGTNHGDANDASLDSRLENGFIALATGAVRHQGPAIRVSDEHRLFGCLNGVERSTIPAMRDVHGHPNSVHSLDNLHAVRAESGIVSVG